MSIETESAVNHSVFVHDFSPVDLGFEDAGRLLTGVLEATTVATIVRNACHLEHVFDLARPIEAGPIVRLGEARWRADAVVIPLSWWFSETGALSLDADIELASYRPGRSHIHLMGRAPLAPTMQPSTRAASLYGRQAVAVVRHLLTDLSSLLTSSTPLLTHNTLGATPCPQPARPPTTQP